MEVKNTTELKTKENKDLKLPKSLLIGLIALQLIAITATMLMVKNRGGSGDGGRNSSFLVPIWLIAIIPIILSRRKNTTNRQSKMFLWFAVGLAVFVLLGMMVFLLK